MTDRLFGTTGVRKVFGKEFDIEMAMNLGKALGTYLNKGTVLIARDARTTGLMVADSFAAGLMSTGVNVVRAGIIPTPTLAFVTMQRGYDAGVMITASHNPPEYTGIKFWAGDGMGFTQKEEKELERIYDSREFKNASWDELGTQQWTDTTVADHIRAILEETDVDLVKSKKLTVVVDPGNGAACVLTPYLVEKLGCKVFTINGQLDGHFPGRKSEPEEESLKDLIHMIRKVGADLGIAHDGDADRVVFVTENGEVIRGDRTISLLGRELIKKSDKKTLVHTVDSSSVLDEVIREAGGKSIRTPVGDIQVAIQVKEQNAVMGGEACGVFILPEFSLAPEPFLATCKVLELMSRTCNSFGELISQIPIYPLKKTKVNCPNEMKESVMKILDSALPESLENVNEILTVDGLGISIDDGWVLVRPSGTEPVIRITCEARTEDRAKAILENTKRVVESTIG
jgi:phosphoglucosamine mutase